MPALGASGFQPCGLSVEGQLQGPVHKHFSLFSIYTRVITRSTFLKINLDINYKLLEFKLMAMYITIMLSLTDELTKQNQVC